MTNKDLDLIEEVEVELDMEIIEEFADKIEAAISDVLDDDEKDGRIELLTVLLSLSSQIAFDLGVERSSYQEMALDFYDQSSDLLEEYEDEENREWN
jgi:hypothetical protein